MENRVNQHHLAHNQPDDPDGYSPDLDDADPDDPTCRPEWEHLRPERIRIGSIGVFAGDWAWTPAADGAMRIPVAFVGTLIARWNGWAVFACTREVAEASCRRPAAATRAVAARPGRAGRAEGEPRPAGRRVDGNAGLRRGHHRRRPAGHGRGPRSDRPDRTPPGRPVRGDGLELVLGSGPARLLRPHRRGPAHTP